MYEPMLLPAHGDRQKKMVLLLFDLRSSYPRSLPSILSQGSE